jgi:hypothetical protein
VGTVYQDFERELAELRQRYASQPRRELVHLCLLALEREELVSVGYRESVILQRLQTMPLAPEVRQLIRHALLWAWKDEEMHAIYIRGAIYRLGNFILRGRAFAHQAAGAVAGWASSVRQHARWVDAPLSRTLATAVSGAGWLAGKIPNDVWRHLQYRPFRAFCLFNIDAEKTAWLCWQRLGELARSQSDLPATLVEDFARITSDEDRHERIFHILAEALDEDDRLVPGETADTLAEKIGAVHEFFLPRMWRSVGRVAHPLGSGGRVWVERGQTAEDKLLLFRQLLEKSGLAAWLLERARALGKELGTLRVAIKPTFMMGYHRRDRSNITDPTLLDELARYLHACGCSGVAVVESPNIYDWFYQNRTVHDVARYFGIASPYFRLVDLGAEQVPHSYARGLAQYTVGRTWKEADFRITFGKMRSHPIELAHLTVGNAEWLGTRCDQFVFVERQAQRETAVMMLLDEFPPHFALLDAYDRAADGLVGVMGCQRPKSPRRLYAGRDALAVDQVAGRHLGIQNPRESSLLRAALHWFGESAAPVHVVGCDEPIADWRGPYHNEVSTLLSFLAYPVYVLGSVRGAVFVPQMDEEAFPPKKQVGSLLQLGRWGVQTLLRLRLPKR